MYHFSEIYFITQKLILQTRKSFSQLLSETTLILAIKLHGAGFLLSAFAHFMHKKQSKKVCQEKTLKMLKENSFQMHENATHCYLRFLAAVYFEAWNGKKQKL